MSANNSRGVEQRVSSFQVVCGMIGWFCFGLRLTGWGGGAWDCINRNTYGMEIC